MKPCRSLVAVPIATMVAAMCAISSTGHADAADPAGPKYAARLPRPLFKTHFNSGSGRYVFDSRAKDLERIGQAFNVVIVDAGDPELVDAARAAGIAAIVEFDKKNDFLGGKSLDPIVRKVIAQVRAHPGTISAIRIADRVNEKLTPDQAVEYLEHTGGVFHKELPGMPVLVDVEDWECGRSDSYSASSRRCDRSCAGERTGRGASRTHPRYGAGSGAPQPRTGRRESTIARIQ